MQKKYGTIGRGAWELNMGLRPRRNKKDPNNKKVNKSAIEINIPVSDFAAYLRSLREWESLLRIEGSKK